MRWVGLVAIVILGCSEDAAGPSAGPDAGADAAALDASPDAADLEPAPPESPALPAAPVLTPCPDGWSTAADPDHEDLVRCRPWGDEGPETCGPGEADFPGGGGCEAVGAVCPEGDWADDLPPDAEVVYVRPGAAGTGSRQEPFGTLAEALAAAGSGAIVAIAKGTYDEAIAIDSDVTLWGACAAETTVAPTTPSETDPTVRFAGGAGGIRGVTIAGPRAGIVVSGGDEPVAIEGVVVRDVTGTGLTVSAPVQARDLVVRDGLALTEDDAGIRVEEGGALEIDRAVVERNEYVGVIVRGGSLVARDLAVVGSIGFVDPPPFEIAYLGEGLRAYGGAQVELERAAFHHDSRYELRIAEDGTSLTARDLVVEGTLPGVGYGVPIGLDVHAGATLALSRAWFSGSGVFVTNAPVAEVSDVIVADTQVGITIAPDPSHPVEVSAASVQRIAVVRGSYTALSAGGPIEIGDVIIRDMFGPGTPFPSGNGIAVSGPGVELQRVLMERVTDWAVSIGGVGTEVHAADLTIGIAAVEGARGFAATVQDGAHARLERIAIDGGGAATVWARGEGTELDLTDAVIRDGRGLGDEGGQGLTFLNGVHARLARVVLEDNVGVSVVGFGGGHASIEDLWIRRSLESPCAAAGCVENTGGFGLVSADGGSTVEVTRFRVEDSALCAVQVALGGAMDLHHGVVSSSPVGVNVQTEGFAIERLEDDVTYRDIDRKLDTTELPVPVPFGF